MEAIVLNDTTYAGGVASYMMTRAVTGMDTVQKGCVFVKDGIKKKYTIPRIEVSDFMQKRKATPVSKGTVTIDGKVLDPQDAMLYVEFNPRDFEAHWYAEQLSPTLLARELPQTVEAFMMLQMMLRLNEFWESHIWRGRTQYDPEGSAVDPTTKGAEAGDAIFFYFNGLIKKLLDDGTTVAVSSPATLVSGTAGGGEENVIAAFRRSLKLVPKALKYKYGSKGLRILVSYNTQDVYEDALADSAFKNQDTTEKGINRFKGYDVVPLAGMPDNTIVITVAVPDIASNLWVGMNSQSDNELQMARTTAASELFFIKGLFKVDTQTGFPDQVVLYTKQTA